MHPSGIDHTGAPSASPQTAPSIRAGPVLDALEFTDIFRPGARQQIEQGLSEPTRELFSTVSRLTWLELAVGDEFLRAAADVLGDEVRDCWAQSVYTQLSKPLLQGFFEASRRVFGLNFRQFIRLGPRPWSLVYRGMGIPVIVTPSDDQLIFRLKSAPRSILNSPIRHQTFLGIFDGLMRIYEQPGSTRLKLDYVEHHLDIVMDLESKDPT